MKKNIISLTLIIGVLTLASVEAADIPESYLRSGITGDFYKLYPEAWFEANPAFILQIPGTTFFNAVDFSYDYDGDTQTRTVGTLPSGSIGGTSEDLVFGKSLASDVTVFIPQPDKSVWGFSGKVFYEDKSKTLKDTNYAVAGRTTALVSSSRNWAASGSAYYAGNLFDFIKVGIHGGVDYVSDPYAVTELTDTALKDGKTHMINFNDETWAEHEAPDPYDGAESPDPYDEVRLKTFGTLGIVIDFKAAELGIGTTYSESEQVATTYGIAYFDPDENEYDIFTQEKIMKSQGTIFGGGTPDFNWKNHLDNTKLDFNLYFLLPLSETLSFLSTAEIGAVDHTVYTFYNRSNFVDQLQSDSYTRNVNAFTLTSGIELAVSEDLIFRFGGGFSLSQLSQSEDDYGNDGSSEFSPDNVNKYPEISFTADPNNNEVAHQSDPDFVIDLNDDTYSEETFTFRGIIGSRWTVRPGMVLFSSFLFTHGTRTIHKVFFNTNDNTLWQEDEVIRDHHLNLALAVGGGITVSEDLFMGFKAGSAVTGQGSFSDDLLPRRDGNDSVGNSSSPYVDLGAPGANSMAVSLYAIFGL